ncbi:S1C family serine protease [Frankia sp. AiPs1]|uniref:S1C family serine protease n=1 Tax=Frankia sp. AiPs1 TaxID=573493 RepID=UPI00255B3133|nr:PDZ domain-containing protein [Frankia sp. AiPs1]
MSPRLERGASLFLGVQVTALTPQIAGQLGLDVTTGVLVLAVVAGGPADHAGIRPGDVIRTFNGKPVTSTEDFFADLRGLQPEQKVTFGLRG